MSNTLLEIKDLYANAEDKEILKGLNLKINNTIINKIFYSFFAQFSIIYDTISIIRLYIIIKSLR